MMNTYEITALCVCPSDKLPDAYAVTIRSTRTIWSTVIGKCLDSLMNNPISQEQFTHELARALCAEVTTVGWHPCDEDAKAFVKITCTDGVP